MDQLTELRIVFTHTEGSVTAIVRRSEEVPITSSWFSLSDVLFFLGLSGGNIEKCCVPTGSFAKEGEQQGVVGIKGWLVEGNRAKSLFDHLSLFTSLGHLNNKLPPRWQ
jgi:hypothetical protein